MFHTFVSTPSAAKPGSKGCRRVKHACEHCRLFRVRCDGLQPCARCRSQRHRCLYSTQSPQRQPPKHAPPPAHELCSTRSPALEPSSSTPEFSAPPGPSSTSPSVAAPAPGHEPVDPLSSDSMVTFAAKINHYFLSIVTVVPEKVFESPPLPQYIPFDVSTVQSADQPSLHLISTQRSALLRLYARRLHPTFPVVHLDRLQALCREEHPPPLLYAVFALSIQYAACSGLAARVLDLAIPGIAACSDASQAGYQLITRCRSLLAAGSFEPSLTEVQCDVLMALYLVNAGQLKAAYNLVGSAVRVAFSLDLHRARQDRPDDLCCRLWWCLVQLDLKCSSLLARPAAVRRSDMTTCPFPIDTNGDWYFYISSVKLTAAVLSVNSFKLHGADNLSVNEELARSLIDQLGPIIEWETSVQQSFFDLEIDPYKSISRFQQTQDQTLLHCIDSQPTPAITRRSRVGSDITPSSNTDSKADVLQRILLKVHYHNSLMSLLRSFICFPFRSISPIRSPLVDKHATDAAAHALALTVTVVESFQRSDLLYGWCDIYRSLWNALLTMAGFVVSYPTCAMSGTARRLFPRALALFEMVSPRISTVARFLSFGKDLFSRTERLVAFVEEREKGKQASAETESMQNALGDVDHAVSAFTVAEGSHNDESSLDYDPAVGSCEGLWSWTEIIDTPSWPEYQDGVDNLFTDITDLDVLMEDPWRHLQE
ncbi:putative fungal specific transcription factor domain-containing protein [Lasiodiplodia theobromae]|uniref:Fungal specific transcription factor domain-containing protein n=1 Tax=Lasiodiplodia theobromae TaxID=45133 RepID=A0A8H7IN08_9PEZI|nr:putative fungal specific transcription factor domain-containing protein [Lasiodiplodia theobromae]